MDRGWILLEDNKPVITSDNAMMIFETLHDAEIYYGSSLGERNGFVKVIITR